MTQLSQKDFDNLPHIFTLKTARQELRWQGSGVGLARLLLDNGFAASPPRPGKKRLWIRLESAADHRVRVAKAAIQTEAERIRSQIVRSHADRAAATAQATHPDCGCQCHENTCGSADMDMAERTLRLIAILRPMSGDMVERLDELVQRAGPAHARAFLKNFSPDDGVPF